MAVEGRRPQDETTNQTNKMSIDPTNLGKPTNTTFTVSNTFQIYGDPLPEECTAETLEQTTLEMAARMACIWGTADADGLVDLSAHLQGMGS